MHFTVPFVGLVRIISIEQKMLNGGYWIVFCTVLGFIVQKGEYRVVNVTFVYRIAK